MDRTEVAKRIKELRVAKGLTQNALAYQAGVSPTYIYQLERGEKSPTVEYLDHICWGLGVTLAEFFKEKKNESAEKSDALESLSSEQKALLESFIDSLKK